MPLGKYSALLERLEDLRDILDMLEAMKEPRRSLDKYLAEVKARN